MFIEIRKLGKKNKYYLTHSYKKQGKVYKIRRYLGENLSPKQIEKLRPQAEKAIKQQFEESSKIQDPFYTALSIEEVKVLYKLVNRLFSLLKFVYL